MEKKLKIVRKATKPDESDKFCAHICNTFFESEMQSLETKPLNEWLKNHPIVVKLQELPLIYAGPEDQILVSKLPPNPDPRLVLDIKGPAKIESWGASIAIERFAAQKNLFFKAPPFSLVREIHSKAFCFSVAPLLAGATLLQTEKEGLEWLSKSEGKLVLKKIYGSSGRGHLHVISREEGLAFLRKELRAKRPVIAEPWMDSVLDFSSQWFIDEKKIDLLGVTLFKTNAKGVYESTIAGRREKVFKDHLPFVESHLCTALPIVQKIQEKGFFGHLGIDAFVYQKNGKEHLHPIVEINARKTMSWVALHLQQTKYPHQTVRLSFTKNQESFDRSLKVEVF